MILPTKHTKIEQTLLGFGSYILQIIEQGGTTVDVLWNEYLKDFDNKKFLTKHSFDNLILTLIFLFSIGAIEEKDGVIYKCN